MINNSLPNQWIAINLKDIANDISYGFTAKASLEKVGPHLLRITDIQNSNVNWTNVPYCEIPKDKKGKYLLKTNDLLFARTGATVGKSFLIQTEIPESVFASYLIRVRLVLDEGVEYLAYFFQSTTYWSQITQFSAGIGQPNVNGTKLKELELPIPPLAEQKEIATQLDYLLAQVDTLKNRLDAIPILLKRFRQSVLAAAVSGKIYQHSKADDCKWSKYKIEDCLEVASGIAFKKAQYADNGSRLLQIANVGHGRTIWKKESFIPIELANERKDFHLKKDDIVLALNRPITHDTLKVSMISNHDLPAILYQRVARLRVRKETPLNVEYCYLAMSSKHFKDQIFKNLKGSDQPYINTTTLKQLYFFAPPIEEQTEIVTRVETLFAFADKIESRLKQAQDQANKLTPSLLAKAFRGDLTADWRKQNPDLITGENNAKALLERIKAEQEKLKPKRKTRKKKT